jgi:hypothetical protein
MHFANFARRASPPLCSEPNLECAPSLSLRFVERQGGAVPALGSSHPLHDRVPHDSRIALIGRAGSPPGLVRSHSSWKAFAATIGVVRWLAESDEAQS